VFLAPALNTPGGAKSADVVVAMGDSLRAIRVRGPCPMVPSTVSPISFINPGPGGGGAVVSPVSGVPGLAAEGGCVENTAGLVAKERSGEAELETSNEPNADEPGEHLPVTADTSVGLTLDGLGVLLPSLPGAAVSVSLLAQVEVSVSVSLERDLERSQVFSVVGTGDAAQVDAENSGEDILDNAKFLGDVTDTESAQGITDVIVVKDRFHSRAHGDAGIGNLGHDKGDTNGLLLVDKVEDGSSKVEGDLELRESGVVSKAEGSEGKSEIFLEIIFAVSQTHELVGFPADLVHGLGDRGDTNLELGASLQGEGESEGSTGANGSGQSDGEHKLDRDSDNNTVDLKVPAVLVIGTRLQSASHEAHLAADVPAALAPNGVTVVVIRATAAA